MKKIILFLTLSIVTIGVFAQKHKAEVLYFKAQLSCCQATACNNLEQEVKSIIEKNFTKGEVSFKQIALADTNNKALVDKYNAKSQTVVIVNPKKKSNNSVDVSDVVRRYARTDDKATFEKELVAKLQESIK